MDNGLAGNRTGGASADTLNAALTLTLWKESVMADMNGTPMASLRSVNQDHGLFCGECSSYIVRGPFTVIETDHNQSAAYLCLACATLFDLIIGHDYVTGECPCGGDARGHGYLNADGA